MSEELEQVENQNLEFVTLVAGQQSFCIEITLIREIRRWSPVTILPHSPEHVLGVMNLRGAVIPIVDLASKLGFPKIEPTSRNVIIITHFNGRTVGFLVDSVSEILSIKPEEIKETPRVRDDDSSLCILGVIAIDDDMTRVLDLAALMPNANREAA
jgi:purine-binding chemotaxis protein CheW